VIYPTTVHWSLYEVAYITEHEEDEDIRRHGTTLRDASGMPKGG